MAIKSVKEYLDKGGHVCEDCLGSHWGEMGKCKRHSSIHTITHMGFIRWFLITLKHPIFTFRRYQISKDPNRIVSMRKPD